MGSLSPPSTISTVGLTDFLEARDPKIRKKKAGELVECLRVHGTCGVVGHGISVERLRTVFDWSRMFIDFPMEGKLKANHLMGESSIEFRKPLDWKEHIDISSEEDKVHHNLWTDEDALPGFRGFTTTFFWELEHVRSEILNALRLELETDEETVKYLQSIHNGQQNGLRLIHYLATLRINHRPHIDNLVPYPHRLYHIHTSLLRRETGPRDWRSFEPRHFFPGNHRNRGAAVFHHRRFRRDLDEWISTRLEAQGDDSLAAGGRRLASKRYSMPYLITPEHHGIMRPMQTVKPGTMTSGKYKTTTIQQHIEFRMKFQYWDFN